MTPQNLTALKHVCSEVYGILTQMGQWRRWDPAPRLAGTSGHAHFLLGGSFFSPVVFPGSNSGSSLETVEVLGEAGSRAGALAHLVRRGPGAHPATSSPTDARGSGPHPTHPAAPVSCCGLSLGWAGFRNAPSSPLFFQALALLPGLLFCSAGVPSCLASVYDGWRLYVREVYVCVLPGEDRPTASPGAPRPRCWDSQDRRLLPAGGLG